MKMMTDEAAIGAVVICLLRNLGLLAYYRTTMQGPRIKSLLLLLRASCRAASCKAVFLNDYCGHAIVSGGSSDLRS